jgi:hypothetical protein
MIADEAIKLVVRVAAEDLASALDDQECVELDEAVETVRKMLSA